MFNYQMLTSFISCSLLKKATDFCDNLMARIEHLTLTYSLFKLEFPTMEKFSVGVVFIVRRYSDTFQ